MTVPGKDGETALRVATDNFIQVSSWRPFFGPLLISAGLQLATQPSPWKLELTTTPFCSANMVEQRIGVA